MGKLIWTLLLALLTSGCASLLPKARMDTTSFQSFEEARAAVDGLVPMKSDRVALEKNGFSPTKHPNTTILTHADVVRRFVPTTLLRREDLDPGILACLEARDSCRGLEIIGVKIARERKGSRVSARAISSPTFSTSSVTRKPPAGASFNAVVLLVNDLVVFRSWGGQPTVNEVEETRNPLGPFQDIGPPAVSGAAMGK